MASGFAVGDYLSIVRDLCDAEELKIKSSYSSSLKDRGGGNRGQWSPLNLRPLHHIFAIENQFSLVKQPPLLLVASSASVEGYHREVM